MRHVGRFVLVLALGVLPLAIVSGCVVHAHPRHRTRVHVHGTGCGHIYIDGRWVVKTRVKVHCRHSWRNNVCRHCNHRRVVEVKVETPTCRHVWHKGHCRKCKKPYGHVKGRGHGKHGHKGHGKGHAKH